MYEFHQKPLSVNFTEVRHIGISRDRIECNKGIKPELIVSKK